MYFTVGSTLESRNFLFDIENIFSIESFKPEKIYLFFTFNDLNKINSGDVQNYFEALDD